MLKDTSNNEALARDLAVVGFIAQQRNVALVGESAPARPISSSPEAASEPVRAAASPPTVDFVNRPYEQTANIVTASLAFGERPTVFGDPTMTTNSPDRLTHACDIVQTSNESWRFGRRTGAQ